MRSKLSKTVESWGRDPFQILLSWSHGCEATTVLVQKLYLLKIVRAEKTRGTQVTEQGVAGVGGRGCKHILSLTPFWQIKQRRIKSCKWPSYPSVCFENSTSWYLRTYWKISLSIDVKILSSWKVVCLLTMFSIAILLWKSSSSLQCILKMKMSLYVGWLNHSCESRELWKHHWLLHENNHHFFILHRCFLDEALECIFFTIKLVLM